MRPYSIVVALDAKLGIGKNGKLPWKLPNELKHFERVSTTTLKPNKRNAVIMGSKTWLSIPVKYRPLVDRLNIVVSNSLKEVVDGVRLTKSLEDAFDVTSTVSDIERVFVIGGSFIYRSMLEKYPEYCQQIIMTRIEADFECDVFFPDFLEKPNSPFILESKEEPIEENGYRYTIYRYQSENVEERQYLNFVSQIIKKGTRKEDRTGVGTLSIFGLQMRFDLRNGRMPLLTTKSVFWTGVVEELLWFIKGDTDARNLSKKGVKIWDANGSRSALDKLGLGHREEFDLGPVYGFQWRHFGAKYEDMHTDYSGKGIDQLQQVIHDLRTNPDSRRIILSAWNPTDIPIMALPPCHCLAQFYVANGELSCQMYQRSCDMGLGVPFNIASYSLLTHLLAAVTGLKPGDFVHTLGDAHVYLNHIEPLNQQLKRCPRVFPTLVITKQTKNIEDFTIQDLRLLDYRPYPAIKMEMAV